MRSGGKWRQNSPELDRAHCHSEIEKADDEKREAYARQVVDGQHRTKRRGDGLDLYDSDEPEEEGNKRRRGTKEMRKKRKFEIEQGVSMLRELISGRILVCHADATRGRGERFSEGV